MTPELHHPVPLDRISPAGLDVSIDASALECQALADRMLIPAIRSFTCRFHLTRQGDSTVVAHGHLVASVVQTCVVSLDDFDATIEEKFQVRFVPAGEEDDDDDPESIDEIGYEGRIIDLGEAAAEQLGLALDPYPRKPGAALPEVSGEEEMNPFAALAALRSKQ